MKHTEVYDIFQNQFPEYAKHVVEWFPNGRDSIRVRIQQGSDFIFTYHGWLDWKFETVHSFIKGLGLQKGGRSMDVGLHDNCNETN